MEIEERMQLSDDNEAVRCVDFEAAFLMARMLEVAAAEVPSLVCFFFSPFLFFCLSILLCVLFFLCCSFLCFSFLSFSLLLSLCLSVGGSVAGLGG